VVFNLADGLYFNIVDGVNIAKSHEENVNTANYTPKFENQLVKIAVKI
jgi:hypothetical protein